LSAERWFVRWREQPASTRRLLCFPYAGGGGAVFRGWARSLPETIDVAGVVLPGRERRLDEEPWKRVPGLVAALVEDIGPALAPPYFLFGHSLGAIVAFEFARALIAEGLPGPERLLVSGCRAPHVPNPNPILHRLGDPQLISALEDLGGTPSEVAAHSELMALMLPVLRADFELYEAYTWPGGEPVPFGITAFHGARDALVARELVERWGEVTCGGFRLRVLPGDHFFLHTSEPQLLKAVVDELA